MRTFLNKKNNTGTGFTLIEVLVVMVIIAIASGYIAFKVGESYLSNKRSEAFLNEIASLIKIAKDQAIFVTTVIGLRISEKELQFLQLDTDTASKWLPMANIDPFWKKRVIPENLIMKISVDSNNKMLPENKYSPQIIFYSSGEMTPFKISVKRIGSNQTYMIIGTYSGILEFIKTE